MRAVSLIEILVAVAIAGILFALAVPGAQRYACRGREAEAREAIAGVVAIEEAFRGEHGRYVAVSAACAPQREGACITRWGCLRRDVAQGTLAAACSDAKREHQENRPSRHQCMKSVA